MKLTDAGPILKAANELTARAVARAAEITQNGKKIDDHQVLSSRVAYAATEARAAQELYDATAGLVPLARVSNPNTLGRVAFFNHIDPNNEDTDLYHTSETMQRIRAAQDARMGALADRERLPTVSRAVGDLSHARASVGELTRLTVPTELVEIPGGQLDDLERMMRQAQLALSAFQSKMAAVATLDIGGFDSHSDHDRNQHQPL